MRILDRERYWAFLKAYLICFIALIGLYIVIDVFSNIDEFSEVASGTSLFKRIGRYYLVRMSMYYNQLCGIISMMAAIFTVTWMQKNNELIAMLAAGVSTQRVIRPVLISAFIVSGLAVANQEWIIPVVADELQKPPDDTGNLKVRVTSKLDSNDVLIHGEHAVVAKRTIVPMNVLFKEERFGLLLSLEAEQGTYIPENTPGRPLTGGWVLRGVQFSPAEAPLTDRMKTVLVEIPADELSKYPPPVPPERADGKEVKSKTPYVVPGRTFFLRTDATFASLSRSPQWFVYASTLDLLRAINDPISISQRTEIAVFLHGRLLRPFLGLCLMFVSLPLVLSGENRNMFINLGLSLGTSALFYALTFMSQYLGTNDALSPEMSAWLPLFVFATIAVARWDKIRT